MNKKTVGIFCGLHTTSTTNAYIHHPRSMASLTFNHAMTGEAADEAGDWQQIRKAQ